MNTFWKQSWEWVYTIPVSPKILNHISWFNSLPNDKILDFPKLKALADDKINVTQKLNFAVGAVENIVGKEEIAGYQHFLLFSQCFQKATFLQGR